MKQEINNNTQDVQMEQYEAPRIEVIEMEMEGAILQASAEDFGDGGHFGR